MTSNRTAKREFRDVATVALYVGHTETVFHVHVNLLCNSSTFFRAAFSSQFLETTERSMYLIDDEVDDFERFVSWLYTKQYELPDIAEARFMALAELYGLADKYDLGKLKNKIIDQLFELNQAMAELPSLTVMTCVYRNSTPKSAIRRFLVAWSAGCIDPSWYSKESTRKYLIQNPEYAADLVIAMGERRDRPASGAPFAKEGSCYYEDA